MAVVPVDPTPAPAPAPEQTFQDPKTLVTPCYGSPPPYYFEGGLRRVRPYHYTYNTNCKERWRGREILEIFLSEFRDRSADYYTDAINTGKVTVNGKPVGPTHIVQNGQVISHTLHRHEPAVTANEIGIIHEDEDIIVIDKPAGVPVHAAGRYHFNSIIEILRDQRGGHWLPRPCNRLDRLTSGVMFIGKHPRGAESMAGRLQKRTVQKEYMARVKGKFPDGVVVCDQPIMSVSPKVGLNRVRATGKEAKTKFRRLAYYPPEVGVDELETEDGGYSIVHCLPLTGRTHQIRVHLQFLGHPITNDPIYSNRRVFGPGLGKMEDSPERDEELVQKLNAMGKTELADSVGYRTHLTTPPIVPSGTASSVVAEIISKEHEDAMIAYQKRKGERLSGEVCDVCGTELYSDPAMHELGIFLHAVAYADNAGEWKYRSKMPTWAMAPGEEDGPRDSPDWVDVPAEEEVVVGQGKMPEGLDGEDPACVEGVGMVDVAGRT